MKPSVSVLLPCRNAEPFLTGCLASLAAQTLPGLEVIAVDDGSTDRTLSLLRIWAASEGAPPTRVYSTPARGIVHALNLALEAASAPLVARMDADDTSPPERFELQADLLARRPDLDGCGTHVRFEPREAVGSGTLRYERWLNALETPGAIERDLFVECPIAHPTLMIRADRLRAAGGYRDAGWPEDYDLILRLHASGSRFANVGAVSHRWRLHPGRASTLLPQYAPPAFLDCKVHHLLGWALPAARPVVIWGAGRVGKRLSRALAPALERRGRPDPIAFVDIDPRKVGQEIHGRPVIEPGGLEGLCRVHPDQRPHALIAVGSPGAREDIRSALSNMGLAEIEDYRALA